MGFSWLTAIWSAATMMAVVLGAMQLVLWLLGERRTVVALALLMAAAAAASAAIELALMHADDVQTYAGLIRIGSLGIYLLVVPLTWFVHLQLASTRRWLAVAITALWSLCMLLNFSASGSVVFAEVHALEQHETFWGEVFTSHVATVGRFKWVADLAAFLIVVFTADATLHAWRAGNRYKAVTVGGSVLLFMITALLHTGLVDAGQVQSPYTIGLAFVAIVIALSYDVVRDAALTARYARLVSTDEKRWATLLDNVQLAVVGIDQARCISYVNPYCLAITGFAARELLGQPEARLFAPRAIATAHPPGRGVTEAGDVVRRPIRCASGEHRVLEWRVVQLESTRGATHDTLMAGLDVTEQLRADKDLGEARLELERVTRASTLGELSAALAHELNQPLAAILSNAQAGLRFLRRETPDTCEVEQILEDIVRDDKRAESVIKRLRSMLLRRAAERQALSVNELVRDVESFVDSEVFERGAVLRTTLAAELPPVSVGRVELQQVLINLVLNGLQAMAALPEDRRIVEVATEGCGDEVHIVVRDHGPGVAPERREAIFEPFESTRSGGLGMGLAICRRVVDAHDGRIEVDDHPEGGARFTVVLPAMATRELVKRA